LKAFGRRRALYCYTAEAMTSADSQAPAGGSANQEILRLL
jgi:hypothetical protein